MRTLCMNDIMIYSFGLFSTIENGLWGRAIASYAGSYTRKHETTAYLLPIDP